MQIKDIDQVKKILKESYEQFVAKVNLNDYLDRYLQRLKTRMTERLEPLLLEPTETEFDFGGWFYSTKGLLKLSNTKLYQLFNISRIGIPQIDYANNKALLSWQMVFPEIKMTSDYKLNVFNTSKQGEVTAKVKNVLADIEFNCNTEELKTTLNKIKLDSKGGIDVELGGGEDITDAIGSVLLKAVAQLFQGPIMKNIEEVVKESIEEALEGVRLIP